MLKTLLFIKSDKMIHDLDKFNKIGNSLRKKLFENNIDGLFVLHDMETKRTVPFLIFDGQEKTVGEQRECFEKMFYGMFFSMVAMVVKDMNNGERDLRTLNMKAAIEKSKNEKLNYVG